jgi:uncharacterized protein YkwD
MKRLRLLLLLVVLVLAACGGDSERDAQQQVQIGKPVAATNDPSAADVELETKRVRGPIIVGEPSPETLEGLPPRVGLGSEQANCSGTTLEPRAENLAAVKNATLCLLNAERAARQLAPLRSNQLLARAAAAHSRDMVVRAYFSHTSLSGADFVERIRRTGYTRAARSWTVGENLAWGTGTRAMPREIVQSWMESPGHRANILNRTFREVGLGVTLGVPVPDGGEGATYNTGFGARA